MTTLMPGRRTRTTRRRSAALAAGLVLVLGACAGGDGSTGATQPPSASPAVTEAAVTSAPADDVEVTTEAPEEVGRPMEGGPVLAVKIDHVDPAYPRSGIGAADVVYVDEVEHGMTRLLAIFSSELPKVVGPVRSARPNDPTVVANYGTEVPLVFSGSSKRTKEYLDAGTQVSVTDNGPGFRRDSSRVAPHNLYGDPEVLLERGGGGHPPEDVGFRFGDPAPGGKKATSVATNYPASRMRASYDATSKTFEISTNGKVEIDAITGDPVAPRTIVVQKVEMDESKNVTRSGTSPEAQLVGEGQVIVLRDGKAWEGEWSREDDEAPTELTVDGEVLTFADGPVWIWLVRPDQAVEVR